MSPGYEVDIYVTFPNGRDVGACFLMASPYFGHGINNGVPGCQFTVYDFTKILNNQLASVDRYGTRYEAPYYTYAATVKNTGKHSGYFNIQG